MASELIKDQTFTGSIYFAPGSTVTTAAGVVIDLSAATVKLAAFRGDAGNGGTSGAVPAPPAGSGANKEFLCARGDWEQTDPMTAAGDMIYGGAGGVAERLPKGANGQVLTLVQGFPVWANPPAGGGAGGGGAVGATGKLVGTFTASSTYGQGFDASLIWDGDTTTRGLTGGAEALAWVMLDLGSGVQAVLRAVRVFPSPNGNDGALARAGGLNVEISTDGAAWTSLGATVAPTDGAWSETDFATDSTPCRYMRISKASASNNALIDLRELEFDGGLYTPGS